MSRIILPGYDKPGSKIETITPETDKFFKKLIYFRRFQHSPRWHFALPELTNEKGFLAFCGLNCFAQDQTQNQKNFYNRLENEPPELCEECASEYKIAEPELKKLGYI